MKKIILYLSLTLISIIAVSQQLHQQEIINGIRMDFSSDILQKNLEIFIRVPENYDQTRAEYPVHYILDAQIIFEYYSGVVSMLSHGEIPECILVGINSFDRGHYFKPGEGSKKYLTFLRKELIPYIEEHYRTNSLRLLYGHSTSGTFVVNTLLRAPDLFDIYLAGAPYHSTVFSEADLAALPRKFDHPKYFYSSYGTLDDDVQRANYDSLYQKMESKGCENLACIHTLYPDEDHYSLVFQQIPKGLKTVFKPWAYNPVMESFSMEKLMNYTHMQKAFFNTTFIYSESYFINNSIRIIRKGETNTALELLKAGLSDYPLSEVLHSIIAAEYEKDGKYALALEHYSKALEINPDLENIRRKVKELKE